jgi:hypothetical protein
MRSIKDRFALKSIAIAEKESKKDFFYLKNVPLDKFYNSTEINIKLALHLCVKKVKLISKTHRHNCNC